MAMITQQQVARTFAFEDPPSVFSGPFKRVAEGTARIIAAQALHARADVMFANGYQASGWALRERAWRLESRS